MELLPLGIRGFLKPALMAVGHLIYSKILINYQDASQKTGGLVGATKEAEAGGELERGVHRWAMAPVLSIQALEIGRNHLAGRPIGNGVRGIVMGMLRGGGIWTVANGGIIQKTSGMNRTGITGLTTTGTRQKLEFRFDDNNLWEVFMLCEENLLRLAHYVSFDGPRLMMFGPMQADFRSLQELFSIVGRSSGQVFRLETQPFVVAFGGVKVGMLTSGPLFGRGHVSYSHLQGFRRLAPTSLEFEWRRTAEGWDYLAKLIDGLVVSSQPGHQYLTSYPSEGAIVILSKGEYSDEVLGDERVRS